MVADLRLFQPPQAVQGRVWMIKGEGKGEIGWLKGLRISLWTVSYWYQLHPALDSAEIPRRGVSGKNNSFTNCES